MEVEKKRWLAVMIHDDKFEGFFLSYVSFWFVTLVKDSRTVKVVLQLGCISV